MLNPNSDRLDYGRLLAPPAEFELDCAVGTTYSLDLDALVGASLALGLSEETDSALIDNPVCLLEALRATGDKIALFCQSGQIHLPGKITSLYILLEKMVFSVRTPRHRGFAAYPSFHPKFWLIRYQNRKKEKHYRVIVLSRNLTFDRSWDVACCLDGAVTEEAANKNEPVCDFLRFLLGHLSPDQNGRKKARMLKNLIQELPYVKFSLEGKEFFDYEFIPNGIKKADGSYYRFDDTLLFKNTFHEIFIISPFLSGDIIRHFNDRNSGSPLKEQARYMLITRKMSLERLKPEDVSNFKLYTMKDQVIEGEASISEGTEPVQQQDIHAKVYMIRRYSNTDLYLGSLNASHNAIYGNVEFMLRLRAYNRYLNMDRLKESLFGKDPDDNPFQETELCFADQKEDDRNNNLEAVIKNICRSKPYAEVLTDGENYYSVRVLFGEIITGAYQVTVRPLLQEHKAASISPEVLFSGLSLLQLSEFYTINVTDGETVLERVLIIPTKGLPEDREKAVVSEVIRDKNSFCRYIAFLLGDDAVLSALEARSKDSQGSGNIGTGTADLPAIYEKMLHTAATAPEKFDGIEYLLNTVSDDKIIPEKFKELYDTFKKAVKRNGLRSGSIGRNRSEGHERPERFSESHR